MYVVCVKAGRIKNMLGNENLCREFKKKEKEGERKSSSESESLRALGDRLEQHGPQLLVALVDRQVQLIEAAGVN